MIGNLLNEFTTQDTSFSLTLALSSWASGRGFCDSESKSLPRAKPSRPLLPWRSFPTLPTRYRFFYPLSTLHSLIHALQWDRRF